jgi:hypothetical protein
MFVGRLVVNYVICILLIAVVIIKTLQVFKSRLE